MRNGNLVLNSLLTCTFTFLELIVAKVHGISLQRENIGLKSNKDSFRFILRKK